jgi:hypothetical protein
MVACVLLLGGALFLLSPFAGFGSGESTRRVRRRSVYFTGSCVPHFDFQP